MYSLVGVCITHRFEFYKKKKSLIVRKANTCPEKKQIFIICQKEF